MGYRVRSPVLGPCWRCVRVRGHSGCMVDVSTSVLIERPRHVVATYAADPSNAPSWYDNIDLVEWVTAPAVAIGSQAAFAARFLGRTLRYTYAITDYEPESRLVMATSEGPFPMETTYIWEAVGEAATRMTLRNRGEPSGFSKLVSPLMVPAMRRANRKDLDRLKQLLEAS
jgi:hypothetical protein